METKIKSVVAIVKKDIQVGKLAARSKNKTDQVSRMNAEYKNFQTIEKGTVVVLRVGYTGMDGEDRVYMHGKGWFKTNKTEGLTLEEAMDLKSSRATFESLFPETHRYSNLTATDKIKTILPIIPFENAKEMMNEKELIIFEGLIEGLPISEIAEKAGYAESTTKKKISGYTERGKRYTGIIEKLENAVTNGLPTEASEEELEAQAV